MTIRLHRGDLPDLAHYRTRAVAVDTETMGLALRRDRLCVVQLSPGDGSADVVQVPAEGIAAPNLKALLADPSILKIFHFARFDLGMLRQIRDTAAVELGAFDPTLGRPHPTDDAFQQRALSRPVGADDRGQRTARQRSAQMMDRGVTLIGQGEVPEDDSTFRGGAHDRAHQIASQSMLDAIAAQTSRSATLCSKRPRCRKARTGRKPRRGRKIGPAVTLAGARCGRRGTARGPR